MLHTPWLAAISLLALTGAAASAPDAVQQSTWVEGRLTKVDPDRHAVVIRQGRRELTFGLDPRAEIRQGPRVVPVDALAADVGRAVHVRYAVRLTGRMADVVEVLTPAVGAARPGDA